MLLEECKNVVKEKRIPKYIIDDIEISPDSDRENSDEENSDKENFDKQNSDEEKSGEQNHKKKYNSHFKTHFRRL